MQTSLDLLKHVTELWSGLPSGPEIISRYVYSVKEYSKKISVLKTIEISYCYTCSVTEIEFLVRSLFLSKKVHFKAKIDSFFHLYEHVNQLFSSDCGPYEVMKL